MPAAPDLAARARTGALDPARVSELALARARLQLGFDLGLVYGWDEKTGSLIPLYSSDPARSGTLSRQLGEGAVASAFAERRAVLVEDADSPAAGVAPAGVRSLIAVPLLNGDLAVGGLAVLSCSEHRFTPRDADLLSGVAAQIAPALEAARLAADREIQARAFRALQEVAQAASGIHSPAELGEVAVQRATELLTVDSAFLALLDPEDGLLRPLAENDSRGPGQWALRPGEGVAGRAFAEAAPVVVDDYAAYGEAVAWALDRGQASVMAVPLMVVDRPIGVLGVQSGTRRKFTAEEVALLLLLASQVAPALEAARLLKEREAQVRELRALHEVAVAASGIFDASELARLAVDHARDLLGVDSAVLRFWDARDGSLRLLATNDPHPNQQAPTVSPEQGTLGRAFRESRPVVVEDYARSENALRPALADGVQTAMGVPLLVGQRPVGAIAVATYRPHRYSSTQVRLLTLLAAQVAPALEAARLSEERVRQQETMRGLRQLAADASGLLEPEAVAALAIAKSTELLSGDSTVLAWWEPEAGVLRNLTDVADGRQTTMPGEGALGTAFQTGRPLIVSDYQSWRARRPSNQISRSVLAVPLFSGNQRVGALAVRSNTRREFTYQEADVLAMIGSQVVPAIEAARLHRSLAESEAEFRTLFENVACGVVVLNGEGVMVDANRAAVAILGIEREHIGGRRPRHTPAGWSRFHEDGSRVTARTAPSAIAIRTARPVRNVVLRYSRGDQEKWLQQDCVPQLDADGRVTRVVSSFIDVTGLRQAEVSRRESEAKSRFLAAMSHELRTPLNSVLGFAQLLQSGTGGDLSERQARYVDNIRSSGSHLLALVNDVLDLSKVAAGQMKLELTAVDLWRVLDATVARMRPLADEKRLQLVLEEPGQPCWVQAEERRAAQVVWNLVSNAIKFTAEGGTVTVRVHPGQTTAAFSVEDTGIGIPAEQLQRIFEEFTQVDSGRNRTHEGTGLGLPLSRQLVSLMGGSLDARSLPGQGSTFTVTLPSAAAPVTA